jgi:pimeloyl-ACP methyl ester carboxylesterase
MASQRVTEGDLRAAMRDPRYWQPGHPEREAWNDWVSEGFRALAREEQRGGSGAVNVRPYTRTRDGRREQVGGHSRSRPEGGGEEAVTEALNQRSLDEAREIAALAEEEARRLEQSNVFVAVIGGFGDPKWRHAPGLLERRGSDFGSRRADAFEHFERDRLMAEIARQPAGTRIVLIGHSWGADTAAQVAATLGQQGRPIDTLVTVDAVGRGLSDDFFGRVSAGTGRWINIHAVGGGALALPNVIARIGGPYGDRPAAFATEHLRLPYDHAAFQSMLIHRPPGRRSILQEALGE